MAKLIILSLLTVTFGLGCGGSGNNSGVQFISPAAPAGTNGSTTPPSSPTVTTSAPLALSIYTIYDTTKSIENWNFQETGTSTCAASAANPNVTCTVIIPEGRLYFSSLNLSFSWTTTACKLMTFHPYYYMASTSAAYTPPGQVSAIDCSGATGAPSQACYGGFAPTTVQGFPAKTSMIYLPDESITAGPQSSIATLASGFSQNTSSNRTAVNDMPVGKVGNNYTPAQIGYNASSTPLPGDGYVANSMVNYVFECRDDWYDPVPAGAVYKISLFVTDQNDDPSGTQNEDDFYSWSHLP